jgi:hypothetical protein
MPRTRGLFGRHSAQPISRPGAAAGDENIAQYHHVLATFRHSLLFYYFGNSDLVSHMMWRCMDPSHPAYNAEFDAPYADVIPELYKRLDGVVGWTLEHMPPNTLLVVMSDHGFTSWRRAFNLNTWLQQQGYLVVRDAATAAADGAPGGDAGALANIDWQRTRAYGLGLNGCTSPGGRERWGIVRRPIATLLGDRDPARGHHRSGDRAAGREPRVCWRDPIRPRPARGRSNIIVGYAKGTRCSDKSALGLVRPVFADNVWRVGATHGPHRGARHP